MADELTNRASLTFEKGGTTVTLTWGPTDIDVSGTNALHNRQNVGTSEEALLLGDVAAGGWFFGINRDATNYIEIRAGSGLADLVKIKPGEFAFFRTAADATPYVIADTAACELEYVVIDN